MYKIFAILFFLFCSGLYAKAEQHEEENENQVKNEILESDYYQNTKDSREKAGFIALSLGSNFSPSDKFSYDSFIATFSYGKYFSPQSSWEAGIQLGSFIPRVMMKYEYHFVKDAILIPGGDVSLLFGAVKVGKQQGGDDDIDDDIAFVDYNYTLSLGTDIGLFVKTFISKSYSIILRTALSYNGLAVSNIKFSSEVITWHIGTGFKWHF